jgi:predicted nucleotidyltransferase
MVEKEILVKLRAFQAAIEKAGIRVEKIILYGSRAAGACHEDSDIDVAVVSPDFGKDRFEEGVRLFQIAFKIDPRIEPIPISTESYKNDTWVPLVYEIREKGVAVHL